MSVDISLIRDFIQTYGLYMQIFAFIAYSIYAKTTSAFFYCLLLVIIFTPIHFYLEKELLILGQIPKYEQFVYNGWYLGFAYTDAMLVILAVYICRKKALFIDSASRMIMISYFCLGVIQVIRYLDRIILESDSLGEIYGILVPTINIGVTLLSCTYVTLVVATGMKVSKHKEP
jgi:hypothetical protein